MATTITRPSRGEGGVIAGVGAAIADRFSISTTLVRVLLVIAALTGAGEILYIILWIVLPKRDRSTAW